MAKFVAIIRVAVVALVCWLASTAGAAATPIAGAAAWSLEQDVGGCWAERGSDPRVRILVNEVGSPDLIVSRPDWQTNDAPIDFGLQIDSGKTARFHGTGIATDVLVAFEDAREIALLKATSLDWHLPWGNYHSDVRGIGTAFAAVKECQRSMPQ